MGGKQFVTSFTNSKKSRGPKTLPWGTPLSTGRSTESDFPTLTFWDLFIRSDLIHESNLPQMPMLSSLKISLLTETQSKALAKSIKTITVSL